MADNDDKAKTAPTAECPKCGKMITGSSEKHALALLEQHRNFRHARQRVINDFAEGQA